MLRQRKLPYRVTVRVSEGFGVPRQLTVYAVDDSEALKLATYTAIRWRAENSVRTKYCSFTLSIWEPSLRGYRVVGQRSF